MTQTIKFSIVTALLDGDPNVLDTAKTLLPQLTQEVQWVLKNSSGEFDSELRGFLEHPSVKLICSPDDSLYTGLNQALREVDGQYFCVIGAGDTVTPGAVAEILNCIDLNDNYLHTDSICFPIIIEPKGLVFYPQPHLISQGMFCPHPGIVQKSHHAAEIGGFDTRYLLASDYDFVLRYFSRWPKVACSKFPIVSFKGGGLSEKRSAESTLEAELIKLRLARH